jgi:cycloeucalenol cycloisomerase
MKKILQPLVHFEPWLAKNKAKRWTELFFFFYSFTWIFWCLCILVPLKIYESLDEWGYLGIGLVASLPCLLVPIFYQSKADARKPWYKRYWVKANLWIAVFSFVGNYIWTHYFYNLLGASYTFPAHRLNDVPITLYFMTHAYFCFYHSLSNMFIRRIRNATESYGNVVMWMAESVGVFVLAYLTAYGETVTIAHFPYYQFVDRERMYTVGSLFYAIYFFVSFPMFYRMDEDTRSASHYSLWGSFVDSLGASMLVTLLLDFWRISFGAITDVSTSSGLQWS